MTRPMNTNSNILSPEQLIENLGINSPGEIDIEAIAFYLGATILYRPLTGCAARIVGKDDKAIITVDLNSTLQRQRFSAAHELGHWTYDRGRASFSCKESTFTKEWSAHNPEARANKYASDLLIPKKFLKPITSTMKNLDFEVVKDIAGLFNISLTAMAIRLVEYSPLPSMLVCYSNTGREWFVRGQDIPEQLWPPSMPGPNTYAYDLLKSEQEHEFRGQVSADAWFNHRIAENYNIQEHSVKTSYGYTLSLIWCNDVQMLIDIEENETGRYWDE